MYNLRISIFGGNWCLKFFYVQNYTKYLEPSYKDQWNRIVSPEKPYVYIRIQQGDTIINNFLKTDTPGENICNIYRKKLMSKG